MFLQSQIYFHTYTLSKLGAGVLDVSSTAGAEEALRGAVSDLKSMCQIYTEAAKKANNYTPLSVGWKSFVTALNDLVTTCSIVEGLSSVAKMLQGCMDYRISRAVDQMMQYKWNQAGEAKVLHDASGCYLRELRQGGTACSSTPVRCFAAYTQEEQDWLGGIFPVVCGPQHIMNRTLENVGMQWVEMGRVRTPLQYLQPIDVAMLYSITEYTVRDMWEYWLSLRATESPKASKSGSVSYMQLGL